jgi:hypothetical protein
MHSKTFIGAATLFGLLLPATAADPFQITTTMFPRPGANPPILQISTTGLAPAPIDVARYRNPANWRVSWQHQSTDAPTPADLDSIDVSPTHHLFLNLKTNRALSGDGRDMVWTALFIPPPGMVTIPSIDSYQPPTGGSPNAKSSFLSPLNSTDQPDVLLSGTFLAGGNTKPIYTLSEQANIFSPGPGSVLGFAPGFTSAVQINQGAQPPSNRTTFDPDSIQAAFSGWRVDAINHGALYGLTTKLNLIGGEFSRSDPSSNIMTGFVSTFVLRRIRLNDSTFLALYPVLGLEAGHNLNRPSQIMGTPVDLSHYSGILRGIVGSDAIFGVASSDRTSNVFAITGSYRMRLPAMDEPFVRTIHEQTTVDLTTRARHWVEVDVTYSPPNWKYLALTAKYQFGSLPPLFTFIDQQVTLGFQFQAKQTRKPTLPTQ